MEDDFEETQTNVFEGEGVSFGRGRSIDRSSLDWSKSFCARWLFIGSTQPRTEGIEFYSRPIKVDRSRPGPRPQKKSDSLCYP